MAETTLFQFTALVSGQVGTAIITSSGLKWRATGAVSSFCEIRGSDLKKFMVTKSNNPKASFQFERTDGSKVTFKVILTEDQRCGINEADIVQRERVILEEARAVIKNQKHWLCNIESPSSQALTSSLSTIQSSKNLGKSKPSKKNSTGEWAGMSRKENLVGQLGNFEKESGTKKRPRSSNIVQSDQEREEQAIREHLLASDESLNRQFQEMVMKNEVISEEDFWESRRHLVSAEAANRAGATESLESWWWNKLSQCSHLANTESKKFNISLRPDEIYKIFTLFPAVFALYEQKVPHEVSERDFWTNFLKSEFLQLGRKKPTQIKQTAKTASSMSSLFASVGNSDEISERTPSAVNNISASVDPSVNLVAVYGDYVSDPTIADVYTPMVAHSSDRPSEMEIRESSERASVINRYNHHAERLLHPPPTSSSSLAVEDDMGDILVPAKQGNPLLVSQLPTSQSSEDFSGAQTLWGSMLRRGKDVDQLKSGAGFGATNHLRDFALDAHQGNAKKPKISQKELRTTERVHELLRHLFSACGTSRTSFENLQPEKQRKIKAVERRMNEVLKELRQDISASLSEGSPVLMLRVLEAQLVKGLKAVDGLRGQSHSRGFVSVSSPRDSLST